MWEWGDEVGGNLWRVTGDITDTWPSMSAIGFQQTGHEKYRRARALERHRHARRRHRRMGTPERAASDPAHAERADHAHLAVGAAGGAAAHRRGLSQIDDFTIDLLGNREVLAINQDAMGKAARPIVDDGWTEVWARPLADGTIAVGLFNRSPEPAQVTVKLADLSLSGSQPVRDVWSHQDRGTTKDGVFSATVPRHGAVLVKLGRPSSGSRSGITGRDPRQSAREIPSRRRRTPGQHDPRVGQA